MEEALQDTQTLAGFDHETDLKLGLLHQQMKVTREFLRQYVNFKTSKELKELRLAERLALEKTEENNNKEEEVKQTETEGVAVEESEVDRTLESEPGWTVPGPFEPELRKSPVGPEKRTVTFPAIDVRKSRRDERLRRKAETEDKIARMITDSTMKIEVAMEYDRNGKPFIY